VRPNTPTPIWGNEENEVSNRMKYLRSPFSGVDREAAYLLGYRAGDLNAYLESRHTVRARVSTIHPEMTNLFTACFGNYGHCRSTPDKPFLPGRYCWKLSVNLDESFKFIVKRPQKIPVSSGPFYHFFAGYADSEGCWCIHGNKGRPAAAFVIETRDEAILEGVRDELIRDGFHPLHYRGKLANGKSRLELRRKSELLSLADRLVTWSKHQEKVMKMRLVAELQTSDWSELRWKVRSLKSVIHQGVMAYGNEAERYYKIGIDSRAPKGSSARS